MFGFCEKSKNADMSHRRCLDFAKNPKNADMLKTRADISTKLPRQPPPTTSNTINQAPNGVHVSRHTDAVSPHDTSPGGPHSRQVGGQPLMLTRRRSLPYQRFPDALFRWRTGGQIRRTTVRSHTTEPFISPPHFARGAPTRSAASRRAPAPFTHGHAPAHWIALPSGADDRQSSPVRAPPRTTASQHTPIPLTHGRAPAHWTVRTVPTVGLARPTHLPTPVLSFIRLTRGARRCAGR